MRALTEADAAGLPILDRVALATIEALLPPADLRSNLALLIAACEDLRRRLDGAGHDAGRTAAAHMLAGSAGLLGFARLSAAAKGYERALDSGAVDRHAGGTALQGVLDDTLPTMRDAVERPRSSASGFGTSRPGGV